MPLLVKEIQIQRNQDKPEVVSERLKSYESDLAHQSDYDFVVVNDNLEACFKKSAGALSIIF